jgi:hypothetical protein
VIDHPILTVQELDRLVGQPADIASSAYLYRADRNPEENPPEVWFALMRHAGLPLNRPVDPQAGPIRAVLCALLWEEIRPIRTLELTWPAGASRRPAPEQVVITTLDHQGSASSWWNNLQAVPREATATASSDGRIWTYPLEHETCGLILSLTEGAAAGYAVPAVRVLVAERWKRLELELEWGYDPDAAARDYSGRLEVYDGRVAGLAPLSSDAGTTVTAPGAWRSPGQGAARRGVKGALLYLGTSRWRRSYPFTSQAEDVARTIVTLWSESGSFSFLAADLEHGPILAPEHGFFVRALGLYKPALAAAAGAPSAPALHEPPFDLGSGAASATEFLRELRAKGLTTIRQRLRDRPEQTWEGAVTAMRGADLPPHPAPPAGFEPPMQVQVPCERLTAQWNLGLWHLVRHCEKHPVNGRLWFNDYPYGILAAETYLVLAVLDLMGSHQAAEDGFDQWVSLPMDPDSSGHHDWALPDRPNGLFSEGHGCMTHAVGPAGAGGHMDGVHAFGPGSIGWALIEHYRLTGDAAWLTAAAPRLQANVEWMLRQRRLGQDLVPGGERLWSKGLQPALQVTPDSGGLWMQFYECEAYYWVAVAHFAEALAGIDPVAGAALQAKAEAYRQDLLAAVERSITLSPVVPVRDGTYHSVIPFACYVRGLSTGAWGWQRDGSGQHVGPMYWETVQSAAALVSPAGLLSPRDVRVQGYLEVLEDRLLLENEYVGGRDWFSAGWQYQGGLERTANMHLAGDDVPVFLRSFLNCYAVDILPASGYIFNEHAVHGPPDKIFEEAAFLERFRHLLATERGEVLWIACATPRTWLEQGKRICVGKAPTHFGTLDYEILSDADHGRISATVSIPSRNPPAAVLLRLRHPQAAPLRRVLIDGKEWTRFDPDQETIRLEGLHGTVKVEARY